jgi:hypothetical protein
MTHYPRDGIPHPFIADAVTASRRICQHDETGAVTAYRTFVAHPSTGDAVTP